MSPILIRAITVGAVGLGLAGATGGSFALGLNPLGSAQAASNHKSASQAYCDKFIAYLAQGLGKSDSDLRAGLQNAAGKTIDDAVKAGDLSSVQANNLKRKLSKQAICSADLSSIGKHHRDAQFFRYRYAYLDAAAKTLGITRKDVKAGLAKGRTLHQMADAANLTESAFRAGLIKNITPALDDEAKTGRISKNQEQEILKALQTGPLPLWDKPAIH